jgi:V/A-type H+-transporting ATPase subunit D
MNLLARRAQIKLAADGVALLKGKREALLKELLARARELRVLREELHRRGRAATVAIAMARAVRGGAELHSTAVASRRDLQARVQFKKVWGLPLSHVEQAGVLRVAAERPVGQLDCSSHVLEAAEAAEQMLEQLIKCAPAERNLRLLGEEVRKVSRRINALEEHLLPVLRLDVRTIARVLDEREREDRFRLKRVKKKKSVAKSQVGGN